MFVIRQARIEDLPILLKLARMVHFINLPSDRDVMTSKIERSAESFAGRIDRPEHGLYLFVLEDTTTESVLGTSQIVARMGSPESPNTFLQLRERSMYTEDLRIGSTHTTVQLQADTDGPTELGGLILQPSYRNHAAKLGRQLSWVRFHYIGLNRAAFRDELLAEMMGPLTPDGRSTLWEYLGHRFINLTYDEADRFSTRSKTFILSLMPREEIYLSLLPPEARVLIGQVPKETEPAKVMLERLGFEYRQRVDPFDGGPHLHAHTDEVGPVRDTKRVKVAGICSAGAAKTDCLVSFEGETGFRAVRTNAKVSDRSDSIELPKKSLAAIGADVDAMVGFTLFTSPRPAEAGSTSSANAGKSKSKSSRSRRRASTVAASSTSSPPTSS